MPLEVLLTCMRSQRKDRGSNLGTPTVFSLLGLTIYWHSDQVVITKMVTTVHDRTFPCTEGKRGKKKSSDYIILN